MRLCGVQCRSIPGDMERNLGAHATLTRRAASLNADFILFPELSLTGYEPRLASALATEPGDKRLDVLEKLADSNDTIIAVGLPLREPAGVTISMVIFRPGRPRLIYTKQHLHASEAPYFVPGHGFPTLSIADTAVAPAICYELSVPEHAETAAAAGAKVYAASVAKTADDARRAASTLAATSRRHAMLAMMVNGVGPCDGETCAGGTAAWGPTGDLLANLDGTSQGLLVLDTATTTATASPIDP